MNLFGKEPQERATASLIHDTNSGLFWLASLKQELKESGDTEREKMANLAYTKIKDALDLYYGRFKEDFNM